MIITILLLLLLISLWAAILVLLEIRNYSYCTYAVVRRIQDEIHKELNRKH